MILKGPKHVTRYRTGKGIRADDIGSEQATFGKTFQTLYHRKKGLVAKSRKMAGHLIVCSSLISASNNLL